jgi:hypothetical protein
MISASKPVFCVIHAHCSVMTAPDALATPACPAKPIVTGQGIPPI